MPARPSRLMTGALAALALTPAFGQWRAGEPAPALSVAAWVQGDPAEALAPGKIKVVVFFSTRDEWSRKAPRVCRLAHQYGSRLQFIGVASHEIDRDPFASIPAVERYIDTTEGQLDFPVAVDTAAGDTERTWMQPAFFDVLPAAFVVDAAGRKIWNGRVDDEQFALALRDLSTAGTWDEQSFFQITQRRDLKQQIREANLISWLKRVGRPES